MNKQKFNIINPIFKGNTQNTWQTGKTLKADWSPFTKKETGTGNLELWQHLLFLLNLIEKNSYFYGYNERR